jgi:hypothetical protein
MEQSHQGGADSTPMTNSLLKSVASGVRTRSRTANDEKYHIDNRGASKHATQSSGRAVAFQRIAKGQRR